MKKRLIHILLFLVIIISSIGVSFASFSQLVNEKDFTSSGVKDDTNSAVCYNSRTNEKYTTIQKALEKTNSGDYIYVFIGANITSYTNITIGSGVHLVLPFIGLSSDSSKAAPNISSTPLYKIGSSSDGNLYGNQLGDSNANNVVKYRSCSLNMRNGADIIVNGYLHVGGAHNSYGNNGYYAEINLGEGSSIICENGSVFDCFGFVKENYNDYKNPYLEDYQNIRDNSFDSGRYILMKNGSTLNSYLAMYDISSGGNVTTLIDINQCPFQTFDFQAFQTYLEIESGANFNADALVVGPSQMSVNETLPVIRKNDGQASLFYLYNGSISFENFILGDPRYSSRSIASAKTFVNISGDTSIGYLQVEAGVGSAKISLDTRNLFLALSVRIDICVTNNAEFTTDKTLKFLLGSSLTIDNGACFNVNNKVIFYSKERAIPYNASELIIYNYNGESAKLIVNGELKLNSDGQQNGAIGGYIEHTSTSNIAFLNFSSANDISCLNVSSNEGIANKTVSETARGLRYNSSSSEIEVANFMSSNTYNSQYLNSSYIWSGNFSNTYSLQVNVVEGIANPIFSYTISVSENSDGSNSTDLVFNSQDSQNFSINSEWYIKIVINRTPNYEMKYSNGNEINAQVGKWFKPTLDMLLNITPSEGYYVGVNYDKEPGSGNNSDWMRGAGHVIVTISESESVNGTYYDIGTIKLAQSPNFNKIFVVKNYYFKIRWKTDNDLLYNKVSSDDGVIVTEPSTFNPTPTTKWNPDKEQDNSGAFLAGANYVFTMYWYYSGVCITEGTLISMADGSLRSIENLKVGDEVKVFNHMTGKVDTSFIAVNVHENQERVKTNVINLVFSNGLKTRISFEHGFFDKVLNEYVYNNELNYKEMIGRQFVYISNDKVETVTLNNAYITYEDVYVFSPFSYKNLNIISDGLLSIGGDARGIFNYFELDENMKVIKEKMLADIETYGLFTYEEWAEYLTPIEFEAFNVKYLKVSIGKGLVTMEEIMRYINSYLR